MVDFTAKPPHCLFGDTQAKAIPALPAGVRRLDLREFLENESLEFDGHTRSSVAHGNANCTLPRFDRNDSLLAARREFYRVR